MNPTQEFSLGDRQIWVQAFGQGENLPVVYGLAGDELHQQLAEIHATIIPALERGLCRPFLLTGFCSVDWDRDYTPWPAPALPGKGTAFAGGGPATLGWLRNTWAPAVQSRFAARQEEQYLLGYSLGGLCALWMTCECADFVGCASCSGSLWYDDWQTYIQEHTVPRPRSRIYLSLGKKEERARNPRMATVGDATRFTAARLEKDANVADTALEWHEGGHFTEIPRRLTQALLWLMRPGIETS